MKLTKAQERAKAKLTLEWQSAHELGESIPTLEGLVARKVAASKKLSVVSFFQPRTDIKFRLL